MHGVFIRGEWREGEGPLFRSFDPCTNEKTFEARSAGAADVARAVQAARDAFPGWALRPHDERIAILRRYREIIEERAGALARLIASETGKPFWEAKGEAASVAAKVEISIRAYEERTGVWETASGVTRGLLRHKPHGVMAVLGPFNFPAHLPNGHIVPALLAGNTVVFKPSELAPAPGAFLVQALADAGAPAGVVNLLQGGRETGEALLAAEGLAGVLFTGGYRTGLAIHRMFADRLDVIVALELGGNNPLIWWDAADVEAAAWTVVQSAFLSAGQRCSCARRLILPEGRAGERAIEALAGYADRLIIGAPFDDPAPYFGPLITPKAAEALERAFDARVLGGGKEIRALSVQEEGGAFVSPGIVDVTGAAAVPDEEQFGPLLQVYRVPDFDSAIARAGATAFGLTAGIITDDAEKWEKFLALARAGIVNWNRPTTGASSAAPFGGIGHSGNHRPSAYYAADYCAYPVASMEAQTLLAMPEGQTGIR